MIATPPKIKRTKNGFTLVEVAIAIIILGIMTAAMADLYNQAQQQRRIATTYDNMNTIVQALSTYVETAGRVPCPADASATDQTFGWEYGVTLAAGLAVNAGHFPVGSCGALGSGDGGLPNPTEGILPFMTLGLPPSVAMDGWGHYFTYAVSPVFSRHNDQVSIAGPMTADTGTVHGRCRHSGWVTPSDDYNRNAVKARFCCADQAAPTYNVGTDLIINYMATATTLSPARAANTAVSDGSTSYNVNAGIPVYNSLDTPTTKTSGTTAVPTFEVSPAEAIEAPAFVLISHGPYGYGAYLGNNSLNRIPVPAGYTTESLNVAPPANTYIDGPANQTPGAGYFDNIVRWMTQDGILAAHGALSCNYP